MTLVEIFLWITGISVVVVLVQLGLIRTADGIERQRTGAPLTAARGEQVGTRVGTAFGGIVFVVMVLWLGVGPQVLTAAVVGGLAFMFCYAPIAGSARGRAKREKKPE
jgi:hypothetical protein